MNLKLIGYVTLLVLLFIGTGSAATLDVYESNAEYTSIQDAVKAANEGDKIVVHQGKYSSVTINKELTLEGEDYPVVSGIVLNADGCVVRGFTVSNSYNGITINSGYNLVTDNVLVKNSYGIHVINGTQNNIHSNILSSNSKAIYLEVSHGNRIADNYINSNGQGIYLDNSDSNLIENNIEIKNSREGLLLAFSWGNILKGNVIYENSKGAFLQGSSYNNITRNTFQSGSYGVAMIDYDPQGGPYIPSKNNHIFLNNFIGNDVQAGSPSENTWESSESINYIYKGTQYTDYLGNYWSDISGKDYGDDGIMDTNGYYINEDNKDHHPLTTYWEPYLGFAHNIPPHPSFTYSPTNPMIINGEAEVEFDATDSSDTGTINYQWDFGDGENTNDNGETVSHSYQDPGTYTVKLTVTDNKGKTNKIAQTITIQPPDTTPPTVTSLTPQDGFYGSGSVTISVSASESLDSAILYWDGMSKGMEGSGKSWHYTIDDPAEGQHELYIAMEDLSGNAADSEKRTVTIKNNIPQIGDKQPADLDGDGVYEDVNGDNNFNFGDVIFFFQHFDKSAVQDNKQYYDFNGDNSANFGDVIGLFGLL